MKDIFEKLIGSNRRPNILLCEIVDTFFQGCLYTYLAIFLFFGYVMSLLGYSNPDTLLLDFILGRIFVWVVLCILAVGGILIIQSPICLLSFYTPISYIILVVTLDNRVNDMLPMELVILYVVIVLVIGICKIVNYKFINRTNIISPGKASRLYAISRLTSPTALILIGLQIVLAVVNIGAVSLCLGFPLYLISIVVLVLTYPNTKENFKNINNFSDSETDTQIYNYEHKMKKAVKYFLTAFISLFILSALLVIFGYIKDNISERREEDFRKNLSYEEYKAYYFNESGKIYPYEDYLSLLYYYDKADMYQMYLDGMYKFGISELASDDDGDGLPTEDELFIYKTNPNLIDTDKDGIPDYDEVFEFKSDPGKYDTDNDGVCDSEEMVEELKGYDREPYIRYRILAELIEPIQ